MKNKTNDNHQAHTLQIVKFFFSHLIISGEANDDQPFVGNSDRGDNTNNNLYLYNVSLLTDCQYLYISCNPP